MFTPVMLLVNSTFAPLLGAGICTLVAFPNAPKPEVGHAIESTEVLPVLLVSTQTISEAAKSPPNGLFPTNTLLRNAPPVPLLIRN